MRRFRRAIVVFSMLCVWVAVAAGHTPRSELYAAPADARSNTFFVILKEQSDLSIVRTIPDSLVRRERMVEALKTTARSSQADLSARLSARGIPHRSFWLVNAILVEGDATLARQLAARADVRRLVANIQQAMHDPQPAQPRIEPDSTSTVEWHVGRVGAPAVWQNEGTRGDGIVIAVADTGIDWDHPALIDHERVVTPLFTYFFPWMGAGATITGTNDSNIASSPTVLRNHDYAWHDAIASTLAPLDDHGHGTHVTGIAVGDDGAGNRIGVAPGAEWIGCRNMDHGVGRLSTYIDCFQWFLAPTKSDGSEPRPDLAPHIISNSWTCPPPPSEDCTDEVLSVMRDVIQTVRDAGILVIAAAGNEGPTCNTVQDPPAIYDETFTVGASTSSDTLASFSSRGAVTRDGSNRLKPDIVAPGVSVRSSYPPNSYAWLSGTSMATPAVSGVAALLWSAVPPLQGKVALTERILRESAEAKIDTACGAPDADGHPNNSWGWGIVDAVAAVELAKTCPTAADVDADGAVTQNDVDRISAHVGASVTPEIAPYDVDGNNTIDETDVSLVERKIGTACSW